MSIEPLTKEGKINVTIMDECHSYVAIDPEAIILFADPEVLNIETDGKVWAPETAIRRAGMEEIIITS